MVVRHDEKRMRPVGGVLPEVVRVVSGIVMPFIHDPVTRAVEYVLGPALVILRSQVIHVSDAPVSQRMIGRQRGGGSWIQGPLTIVRDGGVAAASNVPEAVVVVIRVHHGGKSDLF